MKGTAGTSEFVQMLREMVHEHADGANKTPRLDLADVNGALGLVLRSTGNTIDAGSYGWTRSARPARPWATTQPVDIPTHGEHAHDVSQRGFEPQDVVLVLLLWDDRHPIVVDIIEAEGL